ncbi:MAG: hypothetical protein PHG05_01165 [Candidatus Nanoarchaeia archaeon]|nr:hypothetical protein [Candidatus Nanoarchaeia archaeon]
MLVKLFGAFDILSAVLLLLIKTDSIPARMAWAAAIYLIFKAFMFFPDFGSTVDGLVGIVVIFAIFGIFGWISYLAFAWLIIKGVISIFS